MVNPHAAEVELVVDGRPHICKLTLGAIAELEHSLQADSLMALLARFETQKFSAEDILHLLAAGLRGGGWQGDICTLRQSDIAGGPLMAAKVAARMLQLAFTADAANAPLKKDNA